MESSIIDKLKKLRIRFEEIENLLIDTNYVILHKNKIPSLSQEYSQLHDLMTCFEQWEKTQTEINNLKIILSDHEIHDLVKEEIKKININKNKLERKLKKLLITKDINNVQSCLLEIRAGTGGNEAALFAGELFRMYTRYSESKKWNMELINTSYGEHGGYKEIITKISNIEAYDQLKFESGGHRVQRVPHTESQGRIHTSTCTVAVIPNIPNIQLPIIDYKELRIDTFRSSGAGGQHVNTTDSAIRITHIPTGLVVECQNERSQHKNKAKALTVLNSRLYNLEMHKRHKEETSTRRNLLGTGDRSDRIRTYNFQQGRITDHRINLTIYRLNEIIEGKLDLLIQPIIQEYESNKFNIFN